VRGEKYDEYDTRDPGQAVALEHGSFPLAVSRGILTKFRASEQLA
jgi:hypothetical protein